MPAFLGWEDPGAAFTAVTQLGTMAAILVYFRADIARILVAWVRGLRNPEIRHTLDSRLGWYVLVGTIPIGIFGLAFRHQVETGARNLELIGAALIALGLLLLYAERVSTRSRGIDSLTLARRHPDRHLAGLRADSRRLALGGDDHRRPPARPRSHIRQPATRSCSRSRAVVLSGALELRHATEGNGPGFGPTLLATVIAFVVGYASIAVLLRFLTNHSTMVFVVYRIALGTIVIALATTGVIS